MADLIDRQAAIDKVDRIVDVNHLNPDMVWFTPNGVKTLMEELPSAQPERKTGKWLPDNNCYYETRFVCSCCKESEVVPTVMYKPIWNFCPNCGAEMGEE